MEGQRHPELRIRNIVSKEENITSLEEAKKLELKEQLFDEHVKAALFEQFEESMSEFFSDRDTEEFFSALSKFTDLEIREALTLPYELQLRFFERQHNIKEKTGKNISEIVDSLISLTKGKGYEIGYHVTPHEVPMIDTNNGTEWNIYGSEKDHRDNDLARAYYSLNYSAIYRKKGGSHLYLIRAETGEDSSHKRDYDGSWGRASQLSIIAEINIVETDKKINEVVK